MGLTKREQDKLRKNSITTEWMPCYIKSEKTVMQHPQTHVISIKEDLNLDKEQPFVRP